jgi:gamma-glutamylcyclotransferase (GGCT)/AIG2-like uncharacterized protein YtfP
MISSRLTGRDSLLFVYGTLRPFADISMAKWLRDVARYLGPARARGRLYDLGAYPGMKGPRGRGDQVVGDVYRIVNPHVLRVLDRYEAGAARSKPRFVRARCIVKLDRRGRRAAWVYAYRCSVVNAARIASGDYRLHCQIRGR